MKTSSKLLVAGLSVTALALGPLAASAKSYAPTLDRTAAGDVGVKGGAAFNAAIN